MTVQEMIIYMVKQLLECVLFKTIDYGFFKTRVLKVWLPKLSVIMLKSSTYITEICHI